MGTLKIGSAKNMVGVTIDPSTVLFNDNNVKYIKSGLTEIWSNIKPLVPILTSNIGKDGGEVFCSSTYGDLKPFWVFDASEETAWHSNVNEKNTYVGYRFTKPNKANKLSLCYSSGVKPTLDLTLQASNNGSEWFNLVTIDNNKLPTYIDGYAVYNYEIEFDNEQAYMQYRLYSNTGFFGGGGSSWFGVRTLQIYGSQLKALIPTMTSNTTPSGIASASAIFDERFDVYKAFDGDNTTFWNSTGYETNSWISYDFGRIKTVQCIEFNRFADGVNRNTLASADIQILTENNEWKTVGTVTTNSAYNGFISINSHKAKAIRVLQTGGNSGLQITTMQVYG